MDPILGFFTENLREIYHASKNRRVKIEILNIVNNDSASHRFYVYMSNSVIAPAMVPIMKPGLTLEPGESLRDTDGYSLGEDTTILVKSDSAPVNSLSYSIFGSDIK